MCRLLLKRSGYGAAKSSPDSELLHQAILWECPRISEILLNIVKEMEQQTRSRLLLSLPVQIVQDFPITPESPFDDALLLRGRRPTKAIPQLMQRITQKKTHHEASQRLLIFSLQQQMAAPIELLDHLHVNPEDTSSLLVLRAILNYHQRTAYVLLN